MLFVIVIIIVVVLLLLLFGYLVTGCPATKICLPLPPSVGIKGVNYYCPAILGYFYWIWGLRNTTVWVYSESHFIHTVGQQSDVGRSLGHSETLALPKMWQW